MPFNNNRIFIVAAIIIVVVIVAVVASQGAPSSKNKQVAGQVTVTLNRAVGIDEIKIDNLSTDETNIKTMLTLPYSFNCSSGDVLQFTATTTPSYKWDSWEFTDGTFDHHNSMTLIAEHDLVITPTCIRLDIATPSPTPSNTTTVSYTQLIVK